MITRIIFFLRLVLILLMFDSSVSDVFPLFSLFTFCIKKRRVGSLLCFVSSVIPAYMSSRLVCLAACGGYEFGRGMSNFMVSILLSQLVGKGRKHIWVTLLDWIQRVLLFSCLSHRVYPSGTGYWTGQFSLSENWRRALCDGVAFFFASVMLG